MALQLKRLFAYIENLRIGWLGIFLIANAVIFSRVLAEGVFDNQTIFSYWTIIFWQSWFLSLFICLVIFVSIVAKIKPITAAKFVLTGLPVILLPLTGLFFGFSGHFDFPQGTWPELFFLIATLAFFYPKLGPVFSLEIILTLSAVFLFFLIRASWPRALLGAIGTYSVIAFFGLQGKIISDFLRVDFFSTNLNLSQIFALANFALLLSSITVLFLLINRKKARALIFNLRPERSFSLITFAVFIIIGALNSPNFYLINFLAGFALFVLLLFYAAISNDVSDINIDKVSNPNRPYARGIFVKKEMLILQILILAMIAILVLIIDSMPILILTAINVGLSVLYSVFRFRKFLFSHLIAAAGESTAILYGYFVQAPNSSSAPMELWILFFAVFIFFALFLPVKDLKDFAGDKKEKVRNFLTVFGWQKGKIITAIFVFFAFIFLAFIMGSPLFFALSFIFAGLGAYFVIYYEKVGERVSYINFLLFITIFLLTNFI